MRLPKTVRRAVAVPLVQVLALALPAVTLTLPAAHADGPFLIRLPGDLQDIRYSHGTLDRAARLQTRLEALSKDLFRRYKIAGSVRVSLVHHEDWDLLSLGTSYGLPWLDGGRVIAPAWGDSQSVSLWSQLFAGRIPLPKGMPLIGSPEEAGSVALSDLVLLLRYTEALLTSGSYQGDEPWVVAAMAHLLARDSLRHWDPEREAEIVQLLATLEKTSPSNPEIRGEITSWRRTGVLPEKASKRLRKIVKAAQENGGRFSAAQLADFTGR